MAEFEVEAHDTEQHVVRADLRDADSEQPGAQPIMVRLTRHGIDIMAVGYGDCASIEGYGSPVFIELYNGTLRVLVWANINQEDPTHVISLDGARETARRGDE